jgi:hypothetical protein
MNINILKLFIKKSKIDKIQIKKKGKLMKKKQFNKNIIMDDSD